jgi:glycosyltransferase involved in cell wall biosynthesis
VLFGFLRVLRSLLSSLLFFLFMMKRPPERLRKLWQVVLGLVSRLHYRECRAYLSKNRPDLIHAFTPDTGTAMFLRAGHELGIPVLYHEMGTADHMPMLENHYRQLEGVLPLCTEFAALSPHLASEWSQRFPFLRSVSVLPLTMERCHTFGLLSRPLVAPEGVVFGFAARLEEGKGPLVLLEALARVNREARLASVRIAGAGPQLLEIKRRARTLSLGDACELVGFYSEPLGRSAFMSSLDVFVLPSLAEGTPNSIVEAMAHGIPIIASDVGGIADMVGDDAGILVPSGDPHALAEAMFRLATDPELRNHLGERARQRYQSLFAPQAVLPVLLDTYHRITGNGKNGDEINGHHPWALQSMRNLSSAPAAEMPPTRVSSVKASRERAR